MVCRKADWDCPQIGALANGMQIFTSLKNGEGQAEADAHLIAAAPEMLEALELAVEQIEYAHKPKLILDTEQALRAIKTAIAKARGEG